MMKRFLGAAMFVVLGAGVAGAQPKKDEPKAEKSGQSASCTVTEIVATKDKKGVDPKLERLKKKLSRPPFDGFDSFKVVSEQSVVAERNKSTTSKLAIGSLALVFRDASPRLRFELDIDDEGGSSVVSTEVKFDSGEYAPLLAGPPFQGGTWIMALTCTSK